MCLFNKMYLSLRALFYRTKYKFVRKKIVRFTIVSEIETLNAILSERASIARIGEGELRWMIGESYNSFQNFDSNMQARLLEVLNSNIDKLLIAVSPVLADEKYMGDRKYWEYILGKEGLKWAKLLDPVRIYYNPNITRFYMEKKDKNFAEKMVKGLKKIWDKEDVLIVEGEYTRFGVGNDFLNNARSVRRVIAPAENAFSHYNQIFETVTNYVKCEPVLIALGPTATILAYDLAKIGIWAIDIGHADVEYEWYKIGAMTKQPIKGKYVNEAGGIATFKENDDPDFIKYRSQIIAKI